MTDVHSDRTRSKGHKAMLSIVIPVYNERAALPVCLERLGRVLNALDLGSEIVFVDDCSRDSSADYLMEMQRLRRNIRLVRLSRNFGKEAAMTAGLAHALGDAVIVMDADLQDPPELIPAMVERWRQGADVVLMKRRSRRGDNWFKRANAWLFYRLLQRVSRFEIPVDAGDFRLLSRNAVDALLRLNERNRYMKGLFAWIGLPTEVIEYDRDARAAGASKWGYAGLFRLGIEGITSFSVAPLRWATLAGLVAAMLGGLFGVWIVVKALLFGDATQGYPSLIAVITFLGGIQLIGIGIVGEYVGRTYIESKQRPIYVLRDVVEPPVAARTETVSPPVTIPQR